MAEILIRPLEYSGNMVVIRVKDKSDGGVLDTRPHVISDCNLAVLVRQLAIHTNVWNFVLSLSCSFVCICRIKTNYVQKSTLVKYKDVYGYIQSTPAISNSQGTG